MRSQQGLPPRTLAQSLRRMTELRSQQGLPRALAQCLRWMTARQGQPARRFASASSHSAAPAASSSRARRAKPRSDMYAPHRKLAAKRASVRWRAPPGGRARRAWQCPEPRWSDSHRPPHSSRFSGMPLLVTLATPNFSWDPAAFPDPPPSVEAAANLSSIGTASQARRGASVRLREESWGPGYNPCLGPRRRPESGPATARGSRWRGRARRRCFAGRRPLRRCAVGTSTPSMRGRSALSRPRRGARRHRRSTFSTTCIPHSPAQVAGAAARVAIIVI